MEVTLLVLTKSLHLGPKGCFLAKSHKKGRLKYYFYYFISKIHYSLDSITSHLLIRLLPAALISLAETGRRKQEVTLSLAKEISVDGSFIGTGRHFHIKTTKDSTDSVVNMFSLFSRLSSARV